MPKVTVASLKQQNQSLKEQVDALYKEVKSLKETLTATDDAVNNSRNATDTSALNVETARSLQYLSDEYDDLSASNSGVLVQVKQISHRLNVTTYNIQHSKISDGYIKTLNMHMMLFTITAL